ncbi:unnamed protein product [Withania somnifera]
MAPNLKTANHPSLVSHLTLKPPFSLSHHLFKVKPPFPRRLLSQHSLRILENRKTSTDPVQEGGVAVRRWNLRLKVRKLNPVNTISDLQVLGTGMDTQDTTPSVLLFFDKQRYLVNAMKSFIPNAAMVHARSFGPTVDSSGATDDLFVPINDEVVKISAVLLRPRYSKVLRQKEGSSDCEDPLVGVDHLEKNLSVRRMQSTAEFALKPGDLAIGNFDPKKAAALGLKPGPKYHELQLGNSVQSDHQDIMVHPRDVLGPSVPGPMVLVVDCPTPSHLQELSSIHSLTPYYSYPSEQSKEMCKKVDCVIHLSPTSVTCTIEYPQWMSRFGEVQHVMAGHQLKNVEIPILKSTARIATRRNYLCPQFFPSPGFWSLQQLKSLPSVTEAPSEFSLPMSCQVITAEKLLKHITQLLHGNKNANGDGTILQANNVVMEEPWLHETALPSCLLGIEGADEAVKGLRCIWISHIHADHHTGLARILALRRELLKDTPHEPLIVVGPRQLKIFLDAYQELEDLDMQFLDCRHTTEASLKTFESSENKDVNGSASVQNEQKNGSSLFAKGSRMESHWKRPDSPVDGSVAFPLMTMLKKILREAGLEALISFAVIHCPQAYGVVLKAADRTNSTGKKMPGWKIVYSADTRPCPELVEASRGATVLIHEDSGGAHRIILTHFSQRYPKIPVFDAAHMHKTSIAFDMMSVNLADLPMLPKVLP